MITNTFIKSLQNILLINAFEKSGKGYAVSVGLKNATSTHLIIHDADLEYFPEDIYDMFKLTKKYPNDLILRSSLIIQFPIFYLYFLTSCFVILVLSSCFQ